MLLSRTLPLVMTLIAFPTCAWAQIKSTPSPSTSQDILVTVTNEGNSSFSLTPLWFVFQDGTFDLFNIGSPPTAGLELIAEDGDFSMLAGEFTAAAQPGDIQGVVTAPGGFGPLPVIEPNETGTAYITAPNPTSYQYVTFASMVIPSNDTFFGPESPTAYQVFNAAGEINDPSGVFTIQVFDSGVYDAGTEMNNDQGAAFSTTGGTPTDTSDNVGPAGDLMEFDGVTAANGIVITDFIDTGELVATIRVSQLPEPSSALLTVMSAVMLGGTQLRHRRRRR